MTLTHKRRSTFSAPFTRRLTSLVEDEESLVGRVKYDQGLRSNSTSRNSSPFDASRYEKYSRSNLGSKSSSPYDPIHYQLHDQPKDSAERMAYIHWALRDTFQPVHSRYRSHQNIPTARPNHIRQSSPGPGPERGPYDTLTSHSRENSLCPGYHRTSPSHSWHSSMDSSGRRSRYDLHHGELQDMGRGGLQL
jgi:hypothetical protein